jgi:hypothetical protein
MKLIALISVLASISSISAGDPVIGTCPGYRLMDKNGRCCESKQILNAAGLCCKSEAVCGTDIVMNGRGVCCVADQNVQDGICRDTTLSTTATGTDYGYGQCQTNALKNASGGCCPVNALLNAKHECCAVGQVVDNGVCCDKKKCLAGQILNAENKCIYPMDTTYGTTDCEVKNGLGICCLKNQELDYSQKCKDCACPSNAPINAERKCCTAGQTVKNGVCCDPDVVGGQDPAAAAAKAAADKVIADKVAADKAAADQSEADMSQNESSAPATDAKTEVLKSMSMRSTIGLLGCFAAAVVFAL